MLVLASSTDFHAAVAAASAKPLVVVFTAAQCSKCEEVAPKVAALAEELATSAAFATVSAEELVKELQVEQFPHFRVYKHSKSAGDCSSASFDEVDAWIRDLVASDAPKADETSSVPDAAEQTTGDDDDEEEDSATKEEQVEEAAHGSKKRQEREGSESLDDHEAKKIKTNEGVAPEDAETTDVTPEEDEAADETEKKREEAVAVDKIESSAVAAASDVAPA